MKRTPLLAIGYGLLAILAFSLQPLAFASTVTCTLTNSDGTAYTGPLWIYPVQTPILADGTFFITGKTQRVNVTNSAGSWPSLRGTYFASNSALAVCFAIPLDTGTYTLESNKVSGYNLFEYVPGMTSQAATQLVAAVVAALPPPLTNLTAASSNVHVGGTAQSPTISVDASGTNGGSGASVAAGVNLSGSTNGGVVTISAPTMVTNLQDNVQVGGVGLTNGHVSAVGFKGNGSELDDVTAVAMEKVTPGFPTVSTYGYLGELNLLLQSDYNEIALLNFRTNGAGWSAPVNSILELTNAEVRAAKFTGDGSGLTGVPSSGASVVAGANLTGTTNSGVVTLSAPSIATTNYVNSATGALSGVLSLLIGTKAETNGATVWSQTQNTSTNKGGLRLWGGENGTEGGTSFLLGKKQSSSLGASMYMNAGWVEEVLGGYGLYMRASDGSVAGAIGPDWRPYYWNSQLFTATLSPYGGFTKYPTPWINTSVSEFSLYHGGSAAALSDLPPSHELTGANCPRRPFTICSYNAAGGNGWGPYATNEFGCSNLLYYARAQLTASGAWQTMSNSGITPVFWQDATSRFWGTNRSATGGLTIETNCYPSGTNWASVVSGLGFSWMPQIYIGATNGDIWTDDTIWAGYTYGYPEMTLNRIVQDIQQLYQWGCGGVLLADDMANSGQLAAQVQSMRVAANNILYPSGAASSFYLGGDFESMPHNDIWRFGNDGKRKPMILAAYSPEISQTPLEWFGYVNWLVHDQSAVGAAYSTNNPPMARRTVRLRYSYTNEMPYLTPGHWLQEGDVDSHTTAAIAIVAKSAVRLMDLVTNSVTPIDATRLGLVSDPTFLQIFCDPTAGNTRLLYDNGTNSTSAWMLPLTGGSYALALFNESGSPTNATVTWGQMGLNSNYLYKAQSAWVSTVDSTNVNSLSATVPANDCLLIKLTPAGFDASALLTGTIPTAAIPTSLPGVSIGGSAASINGLQAITNGHSVAISLSSSVTVAGPFTNSSASYLSGGVSCGSANISGNRLIMSDRLSFPSSRAELAANIARRPYFYSGVGAVGMEAIGFGSSQPTNCALWFSGSGTPTISLQAFDGAGVENLAVSGTITATNGFIIPQRQLTIVGTNCTFDLSTNYSATPFLVLTTNVYMTQPTNLMAGQNFMVQVYQDTVGGRSLGFDTNYWRFPSAQMLTTTTNANSQSLLSCTVGRYATNVFVVQTLNFQ